MWMATLLDHCHRNTLLALPRPPSQNCCRMSDASTPGPTPTGYQRSAGGGFMWLPPSAEHLSRLLPQYEVECLLGRGGMGAVYRGRQKSLNRLVAIKILPPQMEDEDASYLERFKNEAQIMAKFIHPGIVAIHDFGETAEGQLYIVMEYVDGSDVSRMIATQGRLPPEHALAIAAHVCDALSYAHSHGVIHRDIKPANILINHEGAVKVADFGLAKVDEPGATGLTKTGMAMGTPDYIAPEALVFGSQVDARADLYAVGVMLYHMLTGEVPRGAFDLPSRRLGTDPRFDAIILKAMKMDREERYQSSSAIRQDLDAILSMPLLRSADAHVRQQQSSPQGTKTQTADEGVRAPLDPSSNRPRNSKSKATMIALASTAAVLATGAILVLKQSKVDAENAPQSQNSAQESQATSAAKQSGPLSRSEAEIASQRLPEGRAERGNPLSGPAKDAKPTAQGIPSGASQVRTTLPAAPPAKPVLVAQANTTPKLGQAADEKAVPRPDHRTDPVSPAAPAVTLPPELTTLQQQYDKLLVERVTGIYDADVAKLNAGYLAGLDRAAAAAQSAGQLDTVLAIQKEKKLVQGGGVANSPSGSRDLASPAPSAVPATDDEKTPEALKNLRTIYRTSLTKLDEQRTANHTALLTPYVTRLKQIEADLTKTGRIPDAVAVKSYREGLGTIPVPSAPAVVAATAPAAAVPMNETPTPTASKTKELTKNIKGDDRKAAEWVLSNWSKSSLWVDERIVSSLEELPKGKISVNHISIDARFCKNGTPAAADFQVLAGLPKLRYLQLSGFDLKDDDLAFIRTLPGLTELLLSKLNLSDAFIPHLTGLRGLSRLEINDCPSFTGSTLDQLAALPQLSSIRTWKCPVTDAAVPGIAKLPKIESLILETTRITDACLPAIQGMKQMRKLFINSTKITPAGLAATPMPQIEHLGANKLSGRPLREIAPIIAPAFPNVFVIQISYDVEAAEDIAALAHFKKLKGLDLYGSVANAAWAGLAELQTLAGMTYDWASPLPDEALPVLAGLKKLKRLTIKNGTPSETSLAAFKKQRPDVKVEP